MNWEMVMIVYIQSYLKILVMRVIKVLKSIDMS